MPWKQTSPEREQIRFIERWRGGEVTFVELCRQFGVSRKTGYKRVERFQSYSWEGLGDWSRAPRRHPNRTLRAVAERVIAARRVHPTWGPKKLMAWLRDLEPEMSWPAPSTAGEILDRAGVVVRRKRRRHAAPWSEPFAAAESPNDVWSIDFKGWFRTGGWGPDRPSDRAGRRVAVSAGLPGAAASQRATSAPVPGARLSGVWTSMGHPDRQRTTFCQRRSG